MSKDIDFGGTTIIKFPDYVNLISDRGNLSQDTKITVPRGYEIVTANLVIKRKEHTTKQYIKKIVQPGTMSISKDILVDIAEAIDEAKASAKAKKLDVKGHASLKVSTKALSLNQVLNATTHGEVHVYAWADGRKYSSEDGVIIADLHVEIVRRPTEADLSELIDDIIVAVDENTTEAFSAALGKMKAFKAGAKESLKD